MLTSSSSQQGFSLLEFLIALVLLTIGILTFAQAEITALRDTQTAYLQTTAQLQVTAIADQLRSCQGLASNCISREKTLWQSDNASLLPQPVSEVSPCRPYCKIVLRWAVVTSNKAKLDSNKLTISTQP